MNSSVINRVPADALVMLNISGLLLLLPAMEICAQETLTSIDVQDIRPPSVGWFRHEQRRWPIYCLSHELSLLTIMPAERRTCVLLRAGSGYFGVLCDEVSAIPQVPEHPIELPPAMRLPFTPIQSLVVLSGEHIACLSNTYQLAMHVGRQVKKL